MCAKRQNTNWMPRSVFWSSLCLQQLYNFFQSWNLCYQRASAVKTIMTLSILKLPWHWASEWHQGFSLWEVIKQWLRARNYIIWKKVRCRVFCLPIWDVDVKSYWNQVAHELNLKHKMAWRTTSYNKLEYIITDVLVRGGERIPRYLYLSIRYRAKSDGILTCQNIHTLIFFCLKNSRNFCIITTKWICIIPNTKELG